jgi:hypothetical protein
MEVLIVTGDFALAPVAPSIGQVINIGEADRSTVIYGAEHVK